MSSSRFELAENLFYNLTMVLAEKLIITKKPEAPSEKFSGSVGKRMDIRRSRPNRPGGTFEITEVIETPASFGLGTLVRFRSGQRVIFEAYEDVITTRASGEKTEIVLKSQEKILRKNLKNRTFIHS
jgi:hypothetical protein